MVEKSVEKRLYKIELLYIKYIPMIVSVMFLIDTSLMYFFGIQLPIIRHFSGITFMTLVFLYLSSYVFKFCKYHRMFIHYLSITWILGVISAQGVIPVSYNDYFHLQFMITGIFLFIILYMYVRNNKKVIIAKN